MGMDGVKVQGRREAGMFAFSPTPSPTPSPSPAPTVSPTPRCGHRSDAMRALGPLRHALAHEVCLHSARRRLRPRHPRQRPASSRETASLARGQRGASALIAVMAACADAAVPSSWRSPGPGPTALPPTTTASATATLARIRRPLRVRLLLCLRRRGAVVDPMPCELWVPSEMH